MFINIPTNYIAVLNGPFVGDFVSASDRMNIKLSPNELQIIDAKDEFVKLKNKSAFWMFPVGFEGGKRHF